ncbi:TPA_asm: hypothetical protein [Isoetes lacustris amalgavirus 1]|nr:TPA_asm: hypothetical protein [Isoetes lacustris amalgavirus 1]
MGAFARTAAVLTHITDHVTKDFDKKRESAFISAKEMDDYCAVLASTIEAKQWEALIYVATQDKIIPVQPTYTPVMLQKLSIKLKDSDFRDRVVMQAKADAYGLKARDGITADLIARVAQFDSARDEAQKALQKIREDGAEELEKLRVQLKQKENQINQQIDSHKLAWAPIYFYETPLDNEIKRKKWNSYTAVELAAGRPAPPKSDEHFDRCLNMFRSECIEEHKADYVKDANVQTFLDNWVQATIQKFDTAGQTRRGNAFRALYGAATGAAVAKPPTPPPLVPGDAGTSGLPLSPPGTEQGSLESNPQSRSSEHSSSETSRRKRRRGKAQKDDGARGVKPKRGRGATSGRQ